MVADEVGSDGTGDCCLPNKTGQVFLLSLEDVMGRSALHVALSHARLRHLISHYPPPNLDLAWHFAEMSAILQSLEAIHGTQAARSIAIRAGRASFYRIQGDLNAVLGPSSRSLRALSHVPKLRAGLRAMAEMDNMTGDQVVRVEESAGQFLFHVDPCPVCWGRSAEAPICNYEVGLLQEAMHWISHGRNIAVAEVQCVAQGSPACTYAVEKRPL